MWQRSSRSRWSSDPRQNHGFTCLGTCDNHLDDGSNVVAINVQQYQSWMCEKACVEVLDVEKGIAKRFRVADSCAACGYGGIDFTPASLAQFGRTTVGWEDAEFPIRWKWC
ncbi:hypothetical protein DFJ74DRAFT_679854 [Hyaloraphidium curvatum]|nr:hypothetical protein DFJ74DRAFT_679854 [Hyaloraphidium curvatum]